jgi:hypothetical protein
VVGNGGQKSTRVTGAHAVTDPAGIVRLCNDTKRRRRRLDDGKTRQLGAVPLITAPARYLTVVPALPQLPHGPERCGGRRAITALLALDHVTQSFRPSVAAAADTGPSSAPRGQPPVGGCQPVM